MGGQGQGRAGQGRAGAAQACPAAAAAAAAAAVGRGRRTPRAAFGLRSRRWLLLLPPLPPPLLWLLHHRQPLRPSSRHARSPRPAAAAPSLRRRLLSRCPAMEDFKMVSSRVGAEGGIALAKGLAAGARRAWGCGRCGCARCCGCGCGSGRCGVPARLLLRLRCQPRSPACSPSGPVCFVSFPAAGGLVRLDIHDNPITADFAADLAAVLARQGKVRAAGAAGAAAAAPPPPRCMARPFSLQSLCNLLCRS